MTFVQAWKLYNRRELVKLIDASLQRDINMDEAVKYIKICFLCTQEMPKLRPLMSTVVKMLTGEMEVQANLIKKPGILFPAFNKKNLAADASSTSELRDEALQSSDSTMTYGTMTFSSIYHNRR